jgi:hypothetical protein
MPLQLRQSSTYGSKVPLDRGIPRVTIPIMITPRSLSLTPRSGLVYKGDSFGFHSYIDANEERACPAECFGRGHDQVPDAFTFIAEKPLTGKLSITINSDTLYTELANVTGLEALFRKDFPRLPVDGFLLLRSYESLRTHLNTLQCAFTLNPTSASLISELELLIDYFLADGEVFKSYGYENLYEHGFLTYEHWKTPSTREATAGHIDFGRRILCRGQYSR